MMKRHEIPEALLEDIKIATQNIYRYERFDRYALNIVATEIEDEIEDVFIEQAKLALKHHPVKKKLFAA